MQHFGQASYVQSKLHMYTKVHNKKIPRYNITHRQEHALKMYMVELSTPILSVCDNRENHKKKTKMAFTHVRDQFNINTYVKMFLKIKSSHETNPPSYERKVTWNVTCMILSTEIKWPPLQCS
jgi:hypothetical protein